MSDTATGLGDWSAFLAALFAAIAAGASWITVLQVRRQWRESQLPRISFSLLDVLGPPAQTKFHIRNHGGGIAQGVHFVVVRGGAFIGGNLPPTGALSAGESRMLGTRLPIGWQVDSQAVVSCTDHEHRWHAWASDGRYKTWPKDKVLSEKLIFEHFFPDVGVTDLPMVAYELEP